ncbi:MAG: hypothetical protein P4L31_03525 [Candidatus Babeliales bacterium]|nr:hypothetical protein [Candidatus Babeliales bacterium]
MMHVLTKITVTFTNGDKDTGYCFGALPEPTDEVAGIESIQHKHIKLGFHCEAKKLLPQNFGDYECDLWDIMDKKIKKSNCLKKHRSALFNAIAGYSNCDGHIYWQSADSKYVWVPSNHLEILNKLYVLKIHKSRTNLQKLWDESCELSDQ